MSVQPMNYNDLPQKARAELRALYVKSQNGLCKYCKCRLDGPSKYADKTDEIRWSAFPPNFLKYLAGQIIREMQRVLPEKEDWERLYDSDKESAAKLVDRAAKWAWTQIKERTNDNVK